MLTEIPELTRGNVHASDHDVATIDVSEASLGQGSAHPVSLPPPFEGPVARPRCCDVLV